MGAIDYAALDAAALVRDPFDYIVVPDFIAPGSRAELERSYPKLEDAGNVKLEDVPLEGAFRAFVEELEGPELTRRVAAKFGVDLGDAETNITLRGHAQTSDGNIHTDSWTKIITMLIYFNESWPREEGRLRLLHSPTDIEDYAAEVVPLSGTMLAFRRSDRSYHGHKPFEGERKMLQLSWIQPSTGARIALQVKRFTTRTMKRLHLDRKSNVGTS